MTGKTHIVGGVVAGQIFASSLGYEALSYPWLLLAAVSGVSALVPDIDHRKSTISTRNGITGKIVSYAASKTGHRGVIHTPVFAAIVTLCLYLLAQGISPMMEYAAFAVGFGMLSHLILDTLNSMGIMWLFPITNQKIYLAKIHTGGGGELIVMFLLMIVAAFLCVSDMPTLLSHFNIHN